MFSLQQNKKTQSYKQLIILYFFYDFRHFIMSEKNVETAVTEAVEIFAGQRQPERTIRFMTEP